MFWLSFLFGLLLAQNVQDQPTQASPQTPYVERTNKEFAFFPGGKLEIISVVPGNVTVIGWDRGSISVEIEKIFYNQTPEQVKALSEQYPVHIRYNQTASSVKITGIPLSSSMIEMNITVYVPKIRTDLNLKMINGDLDIQSANGWIEASLNEGSIQAENISGYFSATTQRGNVRLDLSGKRWTGHSLTAATYKGNIDLKLPANYSAALQMETRSGELAIHFPEQTVEGELVPLNAVANKQARSLKASLGDGGSPINVMTYAGNVSLSDKE
jgi:DUF4097 and DUF4098 domain-containing protein YvlB